MRLIVCLMLANIFGVSTIVASIINQETFSTHLRWNLFGPKSQFEITKRGDALYIETHNQNIFKSLKEEIQGMKMDSIYISNVEILDAEYPVKPFSIKLNLKDPSVELFSFYRDNEKKYILDFWINKDLVVPTKTSVSKPQVASATPKNKTSAPPKTKNHLLTDKRDSLPVVTATLASESKANPGYRDFRYGASFMWNYPAMIPTLERDIQLSSKAPDLFFPIKDRELLDDEKEAHMQLSINFYKEAKWGLMNKSITLYNKKYGRDSNYVTNEFLKVNALIKDNLNKPNKGILQSAMVMMSNLKDLSPDYDFKAAIYRYLIQYNLDQKDYLKSLDLAKELFVEARGEFDQNLVIYSSNVILHSLAELKQIEKIEEFLADKKLVSILPAQLGLAYISFSLLSKGEPSELIKRFKSIEKSLAKPIHGAILYNVAESFYRLSEFDQASTYFKEFLKDNSHFPHAPHARLRIALASEVLDLPVQETLDLYRNAINRSTSPEIRYEAKLRYVGVRLVRKLRPTEEDKEVDVFLEQSPDETRALTNDLRKLLWLVRSRLFINENEFDKALAYLSTIPLDSMKPTERRVFEGDGAEVVYGLLQQAYLDEDYAKVAKVWDTYKNKYEKQVAANPYMNFIAADSFLKLGLTQSFERSVSELSKIKDSGERTFPIWVERIKNIKMNVMLAELELNRYIIEKNWVQASDKLASYPVSLRDSINYPFYRGLVSFELGKYQEAITEFEKILVKQNAENRLTPRQNSDLLMSYVDSLYHLKDQNRFKTVVSALLKDIDSSKSAPILNISERIHYLLIEVYAGEKDPNWKEIETMSANFKNKFPKSPYTSRTRYLYGLSLIKNSKIADGAKELNLLTEEKDTPAHIKEMSRSELTTLKLENRDT
ncbi:MAG TPA: tetratricopeptide repeat protein [Bacteriovoracaceae bacterium]|nr:tetratricopeptide repeat protein [Bacteriovoracaceae bacterium]